MSPKKGYQKKLPTVLPPPVRPPSPRAAAEDRERPDCDVAPAAESSESAPEPTPEPERRSAAAAPPAAAGAPVVAPRVVAPRRSAATQLAARPVAPARAVAPAPVTAPPPVTTPAPQTPAPTRTRALAIAAAVLLVGVGGTAAWWLTRDDTPAAQPPTQASIGGWPPAGASRTVTQVRADGTLRVTHRIHTTTPLDGLDISLPETSATDPVEATAVEATAVEVVADGRPADGPDVVGFARASYVFDDATTILVSYQLDGVVQRSGSAEGRGLVTTTALEVSATQPDDVRVVRSAAVLSLACGPSPTSLAPCGERDRDGQWTVRLGADEAGERVVAAVTVPS